MLVVQLAFYTNAEIVHLSTKSSGQREDTKLLHFPCDTDSIRTGMVRLLRHSANIRSIFFSFFSYIGWFQQNFLTRPIRAEYFFLPMAYVFIPSLSSAHNCIGMVSSFSSLTNRANGGTDHTLIHSLHGLHGDTIRMIFGIHYFGSAEYPKKTCSINPLTIPFPNSRLLTLHETCIRRKISLSRLMDLMTV